MSFVKSVKNYLAFILILGIFLPVTAIRINAQNPPTLQGKSNDVLLIPNSTVNAGELMFKSDRDHDGMTDEDEQRNGTNPNDPSDADGDLDGDGITNGDEVARGTDPNSDDTDGDGVSDAEEIRLGYNPLDPNSTPPVNTTLVSIRIVPASIVSSINTIFGPSPIQLTVLGTTNIGSTVNLTGNSQTSYQSLNQTIAIVDTDGKVTGVSPGSTTIRVRNGNLSAESTVNTTTYTLSALGSISIPGYANSIKVSGNYVYIAAGAAGLQVVDVTNRAIPQLVATLNTDGNANDIQIVGNILYLADGATGLKIISISSPTNPVLVGSIDTPGSANDIAASGNLIYIADMDFGVQIVNVSNPASPQIIGSILTPDTARAIAVDGNRAIVALGSFIYAPETFAKPSTNSFVSFNGIGVIDVTNPASPQLTGSVTTPRGNSNVEIHNNLAYVAGFDNGLLTVNYSNPATPVITGNFPSNPPSGFKPRDLSIFGDYLFAAENLQINFLPIFNVSQSSLNYRGGVDFSSIEQGDGTAVAVDNQFLYLTTSSGNDYSLDRGEVGDSKLFIGRYQPPTGDAGGIGPTVTLTAPTVGQSVKEGKNIGFSAEAIDDLGVAGVQFKVNGNIVATDASAPYEFSYQVPIDAGDLTITAAAFDWGGNTGTTQPITVAVTPDAPPTVELIAPTAGSELNEGGQITISAEAADDERITRIRFIVNSVDIGSRFVAPYEIPYRVFSNSNSITIQAEATDSVGRRTTDARSFVINQQAPKTTVTGRVVNSLSEPVAGATVNIFNVFTAQTGSDGTFSIPNVTTVNGDIIARATATIGGRAADNYSIPVAPAPNATTQLGNIGLSVAPTSPVLVAPGFFGERDGNSFFGQDLFTAFPDRPAVIYSFNGNAFVPRSTGQVQIGSVRSGTSTATLDGISFFANKYFLQLKGQPGKINKIDTEGSIVTRSLANTDLPGEAEVIALDYQMNDFVKTFVAFGEPQSAVIKVQYGNGITTDLTFPADLRISQLLFVNVNNDQYKDILAVGTALNGTSRVLVFRGTGQGTFNSPVESNIVQRTGSPLNGMNNVVIGRFNSSSSLEIAVLGDDRVRIYTCNGTSGSFVASGEVALPSGQIPTGINAYALSGFYSDLIVSTRSSSFFNSRTLLTYFNSFGNFSEPSSRFYLNERSDGDTRILVGEWGGDSTRLDVVVVDGESVKIFLDVAPVRSGS